MADDAAQPLQPKRPWYELDASAAAQELDVEPSLGLGAQEASASSRLGKYGPNQLAAKEKESPVRAFLLGT